MFKIPSTPRNRGHWHLFHWFNNNNNNTKQQQQQQHQTIITGAAAAEHWIYNEKRAALIMDAIASSSSQIKVERRCSQSVSQSIRSDQTSPSIVWYVWFFPSKNSGYLDYIHGTFERSGLSTWKYHFSSTSLTYSLPSSRRCFYSERIRLNIFFCCCCCCCSSSCRGSDNNNNCPRIRRLDLETLELWLHRTRGAWFIIYE